MYPIMSNIAKECDKLNSFQTSLEERLKIYDSLHETIFSKYHEIQIEVQMNPTYCSTLETINKSIISENNIKLKTLQLYVLSIIGRIQSQLKESTIQSPLPKPVEKLPLPMSVMTDHRICDPFTNKIYTFSIKTWESILAHRAVRDHGFHVIYENTKLTFWSLGESREIYLLFDPAVHEKYKLGKGAEKTITAALRVFPEPIKQAAAFITSNTTEIEFYKKHRKQQGLPETYHFAFYQKKDRKCFYLAIQKYYEYGSLWNLIKTKKLCTCDKVNIVYQILQGLDVLHNGYHLIHRDLTECNILATKAVPDDGHKGRVTAVVSDFGNALGDLASKKEYCSSPRICSPEVAFFYATYSTFFKQSVDTSFPNASIEMEGQDASLDMFSLGCTIYYLLTGSYVPWYHNNNMYTIWNLSLIYQNRVSYKILPHSHINKKMSIFIENTLQMNPKKRWTLEQAKSFIKEYLEEISLHKKKKLASRLTEKKIK